METASSRSSTSSDSSSIKSVVSSPTSSTSSIKDARLSRRTTADTLSATQLAALNELKSLCRTKNVYWNTGDQEGSRIPPSNDDVTLLRYLRARDFSPQAAFKQYNGTVTWRRKLALDEMYRTAEIAHFEAIRRLMPQWTGRRSRNGVPVFVYSVSKTRPEDLLTTSKKDPSLSSVFLPAEYSTQFVQPLCARMHVNRTMPCSIFIIDLTGVGVKHFWNLRAHLQKASTMATSHYPESVDKIFILGAPSFFPAVWGYINKWFEPNLTSKISVLATSDAKAVLTKHIDVEDLPVSYGGTVAWEYGMSPNLDEEARDMLGSFADNWIEGPIRYAPREDGDEILAAGTEAQGLRTATLAKLSMCLGEPGALVDNGESASPITISSSVTSSSSSSSTAVSTGSIAPPPMYQLSNDTEFAFQLLAFIAQSEYHGASVGEVLTAATTIEYGNFESFYSSFYGMATRVKAVADADAVDALRFPVSVRNAYFRITTYFRATDFCLHGNISDPRLY
ncbi:hypothetical protein MMC18_005574 [Xylographa bjoerkii]|nr:hypothetical protein [Xylographa bjoerkii]